MELMEEQRRGVTVVHLVDTESEITYCGRDPQNLKATTSDSANCRECLISEALTTP